LIAAFLLLTNLSIYAQTTWHKIPLPGSSSYSNWGIQPVKNGAILRSKDGNRNIFISTDQGQHWKPLNGPFDVLNEPLNAGIRALRYGSQDSVIVMDGTDENGLVRCFLTKDLGQNWQEIKPAPEGITTAPLMVQKGQLLTYGYFPYRYNVFNNQWDKIINKPLRLYAQGPTLWLHSQESTQDTIYKSVDGGLTWTKPFKLSGNRMLIRGDTFMTTYPFQRSFDGGQNWEPLPSFGPVNELYDDGKYQYIVTDRYTFRSTDFFQTHDTVFNQLITNIIRLDAQHILSSGIDGCYLSNDDGLHWERSNTGIGPSDYGYGMNTVGDYLVANYTFFGTAGNRSIQAFSSDNGKNWKGSVEHPYLFRLTQVNDDYFGVYGPILYRSQGDISQWARIPFPELENFGDPRLAASNDTLLLFANQPDPFQCRMWWTKTSVEPLVFHPISTVLPFAPKGYVMHKGVLYITDDFNIRKTNNLGQSWKMATLPGIGGGLYSDNNRLYFIGFQGIKYSIDGAASWLDIPFPATMAQQLQAVTVAPSALYINDGNGQIFYQNAGTTVWDSLPGFPPNLGPGRVASLGPYLFIPDYYGNIWTNDPNYVDTKAPKEQPEILIFPNPVIDQLYVQFPKNTGPQAMRIFSAHGVLCWEQKNPGQSLVIDTKSWQPGVYFLVWEVEGKVFGKKVLKQTP
jgi:hypothetical protein